MAPRYAPSWLAHYRRGSWRLDLVAGLTVTALLVPEGMAYAQLAGVPAQAAFYAAPAALLLYAFLGSSRQLVVAVSSAIAITSAATISGLAPAGSAEYVALTAALALLAGLVSMVAGILHLGRIARFFSSSVLLGFVFGLALIITVKQLPKILGVELTEEEFFRQIGQLLGELSETSAVTLAVGLACIAAMVLLQRYMPRLPAALAVLVGSIVVSVALGLSERGVAVVGELPSGLAPPQLPGVGWQSVPMLAAGAFGIALLAFAEAMGPAQTLAKKHGYEIDANRELVAIGAANAGAGLFQGFPIGASLSKSAANDRSGARSPMSLVVAAAATALVALFLTPLFRELPEAALGAIVIVAVSEMERIGPMVRLWKIRRADCVLALVALLGVLVVGILPGLAIAVVASLGVIVWRAGAGSLEVVSQPSGPGEPAAGGRRPTGGLLVVRPTQMLFFVNADQIRASLTTAVAEAGTQPDVVVLDLGLTPDLDVPALDVLASLRETLEAGGTRLWLTTRIDLVLDRLGRVGLVREQPAEQVFRDVSGALLAYLSLHSSDSHEGRSAVLAEMLAVLRHHRDDPNLDHSGLVVLDELEHRLLGEIGGG